MSQVPSAPGSTEFVDIGLPLPAIWTAHQLGSDELASAQAELAEMLADQVADPEGVAAESMDEFVERIGVGSAPLMVAGFREEMDDGSILSASLIVTRNELGGSLEPWRTAYGDDVEEISVLDAPALRIAERSAVDGGDLFDGPLHVVTWRYIVPFDARSVLMFAFSSPCHELADTLLAHFDMIMDGLEIEASPAESSDE